MIEACDVCKGTGIGRTEDRGTFPCGCGDGPNINNDADNRTREIILGERDAIVSFLRRVGHEELANQIKNEEHWK